MTQEEKAKAYDEALKKAESKLHYFDKPCFINVTEIFPELADSEDERMWKLIKKYAHCNISDMALNAGHITRKQLESWIEKQGEKESDPRYKYLEDLLTADDIYQMSMNEAMTEEAKSKAVNALSKLAISELLGLENQGEKPIDYNEELKKC